MKHQVFVKESCKYTSCYCEENVWWLCDELREHSDDTLSKADVVFISNPARTVPIWHQNAARQPGAPVVWDYHVMLALRLENEPAVVYDLDTALSFPCDFDQYSKESFRDDVALKPQYHRMFRVVKGTDYLSHFASDRSHMKKEDGGWMAEPPSTSPIFTSDESNNLQSYINMTLASGEGSAWIGEVVTLEEFNKRYTSLS